MWSYQEAIDWLYGTQLFGVKLGLENVHKLLNALDLEDPAFDIIHVAGTNGKGSVCAMIERILREAGFVTGLFTSPHLVVFEERICVGGQNISREETSSGLAELKSLVESWETHPTFFEITFALAMRQFASAKVDCAILETGMGGRLDATNAVLPRVCVITPVTLDHEEWLGSTLSKIAGEKAGIIKEGVPVISSPQDPDVETVIRREAESLNSPLRMVDGAYDRPVGLPGEHQRWNAAVAEAAVKACDWNGVRAAHIRNGLAAVDWPARFQKIAWRGRDLIIDGAHNPAAASSLVDTWREEFGDTARATVLFSAVKTKDVEGVLKCLLPIAGNFVFAPLKSARGLAPEELKQSALQLGVSSDKIVCAATIDDALAALPANATSLVCGSLFLAGNVLDLISKKNEPGKFQPSLQ